MSASTPSNPTEQDSITFSEIFGYSLGKGPGIRGSECGICREPMEAEHETLSHSGCEDPTEARNETAEMARQTQMLEASFASDSYPLRTLLQGRLFNLPRPKISSKGCQHRYHKECFDGWAHTLLNSEKNVTCPACRATLTDAVKVDDIRISSNLNGGPFDFRGWGEDPWIDRRLLRCMHFRSIPEPQVPRTYTEYAAMASDPNITIEHPEVTFEIPPTRYAGGIHRELPQVAVDFIDGGTEVVRVHPGNLGNVRMDDESRARLSLHTRLNLVVDYFMYWAPPLDESHEVTYFLLPNFRHNI